MLKSSTDALHCANLIDRDNFLNFRIIKFVNRSKTGIKNACIIDKNINFAELFDCSAHQSFAILVL